MTGPDADSSQWTLEAEFHRAAVEQAERRLADPGEINVVGYLARKPEGAEPA